MEKKIGFSDLNINLKTLVVFGWIVFGYCVFAFSISFIFAFMGYI